MRWISFARKGFSITELMVVISIIATLMALLFPVIGEVRRRIYALECASQLKQIGIAFKIYEQDYGVVRDINPLAPHYVPPDFLICPWVKLNIPHDFLKKAHEVSLRVTGWYWTSYFYFSQEHLDDSYRRGDAPIGYSHILKIRGDATPIAYCREHRFPYITGYIASLSGVHWFFPEAPIVVLRRGGSVSLSPRGGITPDTRVDALTL